MGVNGAVFWAGFSTLSNLRHEVSERELLLHDHAVASSAGVVVSSVFVADLERN